jgi:hypothetical protein
MRWVGHAERMRGKENVSSLWRQSQKERDHDEDPEVAQIKFLLTLPDIPRVELNTDIM